MLLCCCCSCLCCCVSVSALVQVRLRRGRVGFETARKKVFVQQAGRASRRDCGGVAVCSRAVVSPVCRAFSCGGWSTFPWRWPQGRERSAGFQAGSPCPGLVLLFLSNGDFSLQPDAPCPFLFQGMVGATARSWVFLVVSLFLYGPARPFVLPLQAEPAAQLPLGA